MKLIDILAANHASVLASLKEYPETKTFTQDREGNINLYSHKKPVIGGSIYWSDEGFLDFVVNETSWVFPIADDCDTAIVTVEEFRARVGSTQVKEPVPDHALLDITHILTATSHLSSEDQAIALLEAIREGNIQGVEAK